MAAGRVLASVDAEVRCAVIQEASLQGAVHVNAPASRIGGADLLTRLLLSTDLRVASHRLFRDPPECCILTVGLLGMFGDAYGVGARALGLHTRGRLKAHRSDTARARS